MRSVTKSIFRLYIIFISAALVVLCHKDSISQEKLGWAAVKKGIRAKFPTVQQISTKELSTWLGSSDSTRPLLLDARTSEEYEVSHLYNAKLASSEGQAIKALKGFKSEQLIVVYCSVGYRSAQLALKLQDFGFKNIYNLEGSLFQWANEGKSVYSKKGRVKYVHPYDNLWGQLLDRELWFTSPAALKTP